MLNSTRAMGRAHRPFLIGELGTDLCMLGFPEDLLPGGENAIGRYLQAGTSNAWPVDESTRLRARVTAPGYMPAVIELAVVSLRRGAVPRPTVVRMRRDGTAWRRRDIQFQFTTDSGGHFEPGTVLVCVRRRVDCADSTLEGPRSEDADDLVFSPPPGEDFPPQRSASGDLMCEWIEVHSDGRGVWSKMPFGLYEFEPWGGWEGAGFEVGEGRDGVVRVSAQAGTERIRKRNSVRVSLKFVDSSGVPVSGVGFSLEVVDRTEPGDNGGSQVPYWNGAELLPPGSTFHQRPVVLDLSPGRYRLSAYRPGLTRSTHEFEVDTLSSAQEFVVNRE
jgi:hypothetical protein